MILGIGTIGSLDENVLHQLLQWHTFYVHTTPYWRIISDGIFHLVSAGLLLGGGLLLAWQRPQFGDPIQSRALLAGMLFGMGGFALYDGTIQQWSLPYRRSVLVHPHHRAEPEGRFGSTALLPAGRKYGSVIRDVLQQRIFMKVSIRFAWQQ